MTPRESQRIVRRLASAEGYLEIGLPARALTEIETVPDPGPFEAIATLLRGEALQQAERFDEAIPALNKAAELFPSPFNQRALIGLSQCYRHRGELDLAAQAEAAANSANLSPAEILKLVLTPIFQVQSAPKRAPLPPKG